MPGRIGSVARRFLLLWLFVLCVAGCAAASGGGRHTVSEEPADATELLSLDPDPQQADGSPGSDGEAFHGYRVLGRVALGAPESERAVAALSRAERESDGRAVKCFNPRHGLSVTRGSERVDYVICFECLQMKEHRGSAERVVLIARTAEDDLDALLAKHGVKRPVN